MNFTVCVWCKCFVDFTVCVWCKRFVDFTVCVWCKRFVDFTVGDGFFLFFFLAMAIMESAVGLGEEMSALFTFPSLPGTHIYIYTI